MRTHWLAMLVCALPLQAVAQQQTSAQLRMEAAKLLHSGALKAARRKLDAAIKLNPRSSHSYFYRGIAHARLRERIKALADLNRCISLNPNIPAAYIERGKLFLAMASPGLAFADFDLAIELEPENGEAYFYRGKTHAVRHELDRATGDYSRALTHAPTATFIHLHRGLAYLDQGALARAAAETKALKTARHDSASLLSALLEVHRQLRTAGLDLAAFHAVFTAKRQAWSWLPGPRSKVTRAALETLGATLSRSLRASALAELRTGHQRSFTRSSASLNIRVLQFASAAGAGRFMPFSRARIARRAAAYTQRRQLRHLGPIRPPAQVELAAGVSGWSSALRLGLDTTVFVTRALSFVHGRWVVELDLMAPEKDKVPDLTALARALCAELARQQQK